MELHCLVIPVMLLRFPTGLSEEVLLLPCNVGVGRGSQL